MPPKAIVYLASVFKLMKGLKLPWHRRRINAALKRDLKMLATVLKSNHGRGYFCHAHFDRAPAVWTDASKERGNTGGGYISGCGAYDHWIFGSSEARQPIHYLEGAAVLRAARDLGPTWKNKVVPIYIDNSSFQLSLVKGWSKSDLLVELLRELFLLSVKYEFIFEPHWISTHDNIAADALSRGQQRRFLQCAGGFIPRGVHLHRHC